MRAGRTAVVPAAVVGCWRPRARADPNAFYVEVETASFPGGAIRGRLDHSQDESTTPRRTGPGHLFASMSAVRGQLSPSD